MRILIAIIGCFTAFSVFAQVPQGIGYQGVATDSQGLELVNQSISIRSSILSGSVNGTVEWQEVHNTTTDDFGLFALTIGEGNSTGGGMLSNFADIQWGESTYFLQIEMDATGGTDYSLMGVNQMMSVPYALYAESTNLDYDSIVNNLSYDTIIENLNEDSIFQTILGNQQNNTLTGKFNFHYPEGINGTGIIKYVSEINPYVVPDGKRLYILGRHFTGVNLKINDFEIASPYGLTPFLPVPVNAGSSVNASNSSTVPFYGLLVNEVEGLSALTIQLNQNSSAYTVPNGQTLVICKSFNGDSFFVNDIEIGSQYLHNHIIVNEGDVITISNGNVTLSGYLVVGDYFDSISDSGNNDFGQYEETIIDYISVMPNDTVHIAESSDIVFLTSPAINNDEVAHIILPEANSFKRLELCFKNIDPNFGSFGFAIYESSIICGNPDGLCIRFTVSNNINYPQFHQFVRDNDGRWYTSTSYN